jgi:YhfC intramembrane metalloprotease
VQNIDPLFILQPVVVIIVASALMVYWYFKRRFHKEVWLYTLIAYGAAIALKYAVQIPTITLVTNAFGAHSLGLGIYYGLQTAVFEVGLAFVVAWWAVSHGKLAEKDAEAYGAGLAFWENAAFLSALSLVNLVSYYVILSNNTSLAKTLYTQLNTTAPGLFASASEALRSVVLGTLERVSSIMIHFSWGYLCIMAAVYRKKWLFLIALPMGFIDFLVPFAQNSIVLFEAVFFSLSILSLLVAWYATKQVRKHKEDQIIKT